MHVPQDTEAVCREALCKGREAFFARLMMADEDPQAALFGHYDEHEITALTLCELKLVEQTAVHYTPDGWGRWAMRRHLAYLAMRELTFLCELIGTLDSQLLILRSAGRMPHRDRRGWSILAKRRFLLQVRDIRKEAQV